MTRSSPTTKPKNYSTNSTRNDTFNNRLCRRMWRMWNCVQFQRFRAIRIWWCLCGRANHQRPWLAQGKWATPLWGLLWRVYEQRIGRRLPMTHALIQFVAHLISMAITTLIVVWIINRFTNEPKHHFTYEYKDVSFMLNQRWRLYFIWSSQWIW